MNRVTRKSRNYRTRVLFYLVPILILISVGIWAGRLWHQNQCKYCDKQVESDAKRLSNALDRLKTELQDFNCDPAKWEFTEGHLRSLVGPYYGFRGGSGKCDTLFSVHGNEIWVCSRIGTPQEGNNTRKIFRISTDLTRSGVEKMLPPIVGEGVGRRLPHQSGGMEVCFTESMVNKSDCSYRFGRKPRGDQRLIRECEERQERKLDNADNHLTLSNKAITAFSIDLYRKVLEREDNLVLSPFSVFATLVMGYEGAKGETRTQMAKALHIDKLEVPLHPTLGSLISYLDCSIVSANGVLSAANALWGQKDYGFLKEYQNVLFTYYGIAIKEVDFRRNLGEAETAINSWIAEKTQGKIRQMVSLKSNEVSPATILAANAIYFNCAWADEFKKNRTKNDIFFLLNRREISVPLMNAQRGFKYMENQDMQGVELPYSGDEYSMVVFLPRSKDGLPALEKTLTPEKLTSWIDSLDSWRWGVIVYLPRFFINSRFGLSDALQKLGIKLPFERFKANFSGMSGPRSPQDQLFMAGAIHEAGIDVTEEGTEAWAATLDCRCIGGADDTPSSPTEPKVFRADHPFMFVVRHNPSNCILFIGRVTEPQ